MANFKNENLKDALEIKDLRSGHVYEIPITHNAIKAVDLKAIRLPSLGSNAADQVHRGLRVFDPGYENTCVEEQEISFMYNLLESTDNLSPV